MAYGMGGGGGGGGGSAASQRERQERRENYIARFLLLIAISSCGLNASSAYSLSGGTIRHLSFKLTPGHVRLCPVEARSRIRPRHQRSSLSCNGNCEDANEEPRNSPSGLEGLSLEEIESLPELGELSCGDRPPMLEEIMQEDVRFDYKMRALRGEFSPQAGEDTEDSFHLAEAILKFPGPCEVRVVVRNEGDVAEELSNMLSSVEGLQVVSKTEEPRMGSKFLAIQFQVMVESALVRQRAFEILAQDKRVKMKF
eukprot:280841-Hanusia_phi.AAC.1